MVYFVGLRNIYQWLSEYKHDKNIKGKLVSNGEIFFPVSMLAFLPVSNNARTDNFYNDMLLYYFIYLWLKITIYNKATR